MSDDAINRGGQQLGQRAVLTDDISDGVLLPEAGRNRGRNGGGEEKARETGEFGLARAQSLGFRGVGYRA